MSREPAPVTWWFPPVARGRVAALRVLTAVFVPIDVWWATAWVHEHGRVPEVLYRPVALARILHVPAADPLTMDLLRWGLTVAALVLAATQILTRAPDAARRAACGVLAVLYLWWMLLAMSYGKVDHDRYGFIVLLAVLATVPAAHVGDRRPSEAAGWAVRMVQVAVVATYLLAAVAKVRFGGWAWADGATFVRAIVRRGTFLVDWMLQAPWTLRLAQWLLLLFEFAAPLMFAIRRERTLVIVVVSLYAFHLVTFAALGIIFLPHLVALAAFLPLERLSVRTGAARLRQRALGRAPGEAMPVP